VIGVTGSTGKTTTKDMLRAVLERTMRVVATEGNQNNELGVPLTILRASVDSEALIVEMAMRGSGQIARLCDIAQPTIGLVTNVGETHMELLGSQTAIAAAKAELVKAVPREGVVFLNGDDAWTDSLAESTAASVVRYGLGEANDVRAIHVDTDVEGHPSFEIEAPQVCFPVTLAIPGRHNAYNAAAVAGVSLHMGVDPGDVRTGLEAASLSPMRMEVFQSAGGVTVVNDAYNASPTSMRAAVETLSDMDVEGRRVAVLGDMAELGSLAELAHFELGEYVASLGFDRLVAVGQRAARIADGARASGMDPGDVVDAVDADAVAPMLEAYVEPGDAVLVKASRVMGLERVVEALTRPHV
jgi:UDP-N-acetylmuramoyl-tripeptide--D-alanyl-D-alanine ligase